MSQSARPGRRLAAAVTRRAPLADVATAYRLVHGEADGCPSLVVDKYDRWLVVQLASAGIEPATFRVSVEGCQNIATVVKPSVSQRDWLHETYGQYATNIGVSRVFTLGAQTKLFPSFRHSSYLCRFGPAH